VIITILLNIWIFPVQNWANDGAFRPHLATRQATVTDGPFRCSCKLVNNSRWRWKDKYSMVSEICSLQKNA